VYTVQEIAGATATPFSRIALTENQFAVGKIAKRKSEEVNVNSALKIQYQIVKNTLVQTAFSAMLPTGLH